jgi:hypothetical protein
LLAAAGLRLEITQQVFAIQSRLQQQVAEVARKLSGTESP